MKKILLFIALSFLIIKVNAQFILTSAGFKDSLDTSKDYIVLKFDNRSQNELYNKSLQFITSKYISPKDVISKVEPSMISVNGFVENGIGNGRISKKSFLATWDLSYTIVFNFKDGKVKIDAPFVEMKGYSSGRVNRLTLCESNLGFGSEVVTNIFNKKGNVVKEEPKQQLESFFNSFCKNYCEYVMKQEENW